MRSNPLILGLLAMCAIAILADSIPVDAVEAHKRADSILFPAFVSACNDYSSQHPTTNPQHFLTINKGDRERLELANKRWREFYDAMKR
jgi:hypothetical protein